MSASESSCPSATGAEDFKEVDTENMNITEGTKVNLYGHSVNQEWPSVPASWTSVEGLVITHKVGLDVESYLRWMKSYRGAPRAQVAVHWIRHLPEMRSNLSSIALTFVKNVDDEIVPLPDMSGCEKVGVS